jgi:hypothetical protein
MGDVDVEATMRTLIRLLVTGGINPVNPNGPGYTRAAYDYLERLAGGG